MCGIAGIINFEKAVQVSDLKRICDHLIQRGPDSDGYYCADNVGLGHRRLSILDLDTGDQPMISIDGQVVLVFNGEIYNYRALRKDLIDMGDSFRTKSDAEVIIIGYQRWGIDGILSRLEGMFAFAIYDRNQESVFIARDRFGEKPLYYCQDGERFIFASELKAIKGEISDLSIDLDAVNLFLSLSYIPAPYTIFSNIRKLLPSHYMTFHPGELPKTVCYYDLLANVAGKEKYSEILSAESDLRNLLFDSVEKRMMSDVPFGSFLSGGIDSSIITAIMSKVSTKPVKTFVIGFQEKEYDESERAALVANMYHTHHLAHCLKYGDVIDDLDDIITYFDEPFGDSSAIPSYYVAKLARQSVKMVLTGDCADELFGGYEKYLATYYRDRFLSLPSFLQTMIKMVIDVMPHTRLTNSILRRAKKVINSLNISDFDLHYEYMCLGFTDQERKDVLINSVHREVKDMIREPFDRYQASAQEKGYFTDLTTVLEGDMLVKVDRMCMKNSLEARVPFLDSRIVEFAYSLPNNFKIKGKNKKYILKSSFGDLLPKETVNFRKKGFGVPVDYWLKNELKSEMEEVLSEDFITRQGLFNGPYLRSLYSQHLLGKENHKGKLWNIFVFQKWYKSNVIEA